MATFAAISLSIVGAVLGHSVVPLRLLFQFVQIRDVGEKHGPGRLRLRAGWVQINFLVLAIVGAQPDYVAFAGSDENQLILAKESEKR